MPASHRLLLGTAGLQSNDYNYCGFKQADLVICVGYDMVEYHPYLWRRESQQVAHIHFRTAAEVDEHYIVAGGLVGHIGAGIAGLTVRSAVTATAPPAPPAATCWRRSGRADDEGFPVKPQKIVHDLRRRLGRTTSSSATWGPTRCGWPACTRPSGQTPASSPTALQPWGSPFPGRWRPPRASPPGRRGRHRRRRLHAELPGARDGCAARPALRRAHLERFLLRADRVEAGLPAGPHELCTFR